MRSVVVHAVLLVAALTAATLSWTASNRQYGDVTAVIVWDQDVDDVTQVTFQDSTQDLRIERRGEGQASYLWGIAHFPAAPTTAVTGLERPNGPLPMQTDEYPVGTEGRTALESVTRLRAIRDLGEGDAKARERFGIPDSLPLVRIQFADGTAHSLVFAPTVSAGVRYVLDIEAERIYAVAPDLLSPFEQGAGAFRLTRFQSYVLDDVGSVSIKNGAGKEIRREKHQQGIPARTSWRPEGKTDDDVVFGNIVDQLDRMFAEVYLPELKETDLDLIGRVDYNDLRGRPSAWIELYRSKGDGGEPVYYVKSDVTRVLGKVYEGQGKIFANDMTTLFRGL